MLARPCAWGHKLGKDTALEGREWSVVAVTVTLKGKGCDGAQKALGEHGR